ncbi:MAG: hypothetical protein ACFFAF_18050, partial [Candidatus Hermodarchaeota archaeon]
MAKKKKKTEAPKKTEEKEKKEVFNFEEDFEEDFEDDLDLVEELDLLDTESIEEEVEPLKKIIDKDEEQKQLYLSCGIHIGTKLLSGDARRFI